jgi:Fe2+ transport system protein FeoA
MEEDIMKEVRREDEIKERLIEMGIGEVDMMALADP